MQFQQVAETILPNERSLKKAGHRVVWHRGLRSRTIQSDEREPLAHLWWAATTSHRLIVAHQSDTSSSFSCAYASSQTIGHILCDL